MCSSLLQVSNSSDVRNNVVGARSDFVKPMKNHSFLAFLCFIGTKKK